LIIKKCTPRIRNTDH